jgi:FlaA1/EpsC-like NDP-sugar epimerase
VKPRLRMLILMLLDAIIVNLSMAVLLAMRYAEGIFRYQDAETYLSLAPLVTVIYITVFFFFKLYNRAWAYASIGELSAVVAAVTLGSLGSQAAYYFAGARISYGLALGQWAAIILLMGGSRLLWRFIIVRTRQNGHKPDRRALIIGAGDAGVMVARELRGRNGNAVPVGFIDDDPDKRNINVLGLPVLGNRHQIPDVVARHRIDLNIIAMPSVGASVIREIVDICRKTQVELKILLGVYQIINGRVSVNSLRPVKLEDLLRREPVRVNVKEIASYLNDKVVLVTGAGGSIGSELCRQVAGVGPKKLILLGHGENSIHNIWLELKDKFPGLNLAVEIADVRDKPRVDLVFQTHRPEVVFHAAAHKHVPLMELHPAEAVKTNVFGTRNLAQAAERYGAQGFLLISTDKAVNPSSVMGATKRLAELIITQENKTSETKFVAVRFGNVLGSSGSVVPIFQRQIEKGGPVTVTHPEMKRYFMTIPEAVQLVIQAGAMAQGGEVFVLDMGEPVKIVDLARDMIRLSGLEPGRDIQIEFTGIRPGEKLFEELLTAEEGSNATKHKRIFTAHPVQVEAEALEDELHKLRELGCNCKGQDIFDTLTTLIPRFRSNRKVQAG